MDPNSLRIALAREVTSRYVSSPGFHAALLTGSVASARADDNSDIDLILFYEGEFTQDFLDREVAAARATGGDQHNGGPGEGFALYHFLGGIKCDIAFVRRPTYEGFVTTMLTEPHLDPITHLILSGLLKGIPLHGEALLTGWQERLRAFPPALRDRMVRHHLSFMPLWATEQMGLARGDGAFVAECLLKGAENIVGILCGLNSQYLPGKLKGLAALAEQLPVAPPEVGVRLDSLFKREQHHAVAELASLVEQTLALVELHLPHIDTSRVRKRWSIRLRR